MKSWLRNLATVGALGLGALLVSNCSNRTGDRDTTTSRTDQTTPGYGGAGTQTSDSKSPEAYTSQTPSTSDQTPKSTDPNQSTRTPEPIGSSSSTTGTPPSTDDTTGRSPPTTPPSDTTGSSTNPDTSSRPDRPRQ